MNYQLTAHIIYLLISVCLTVAAAQTLYRHGRQLLVEAFGSEKLGDSINRLLLMGFYLVNIGLASFFLRFGAVPHNTVELIEVLSTKLGLVMFFLGALHFANMCKITKIRRDGKDKGSEQASEQDLAHLPPFQKTRAKPASPVHGEVIA